MKEMKIILCILCWLSVISSFKLTRKEETSKYPTFVHLDIVMHSAHLFCGGTYIEQYWVLTAAHCLDEALSGPPRVGKPDRVTLYMGVTRYRGGPRQKRASEILILHPRYVSNFENGRSFVQTKQKEYDIGLIKITAPFIANDYVQIAKMADKFSDRPRLIGIRYSLEPIELIGCRKEKNANIVSCQLIKESKDDQLYNGSPLYLYDSNDVAGIYVRTYDEEYGVMTTEYHAWIMTTIKLETKDKKKRIFESIEREKVPNNTDAIFIFAKYIYILILFITCKLIY